MPVKSAKQFRFMEAAAHNGLKGAGPSASVAKEFLNKTSHAAKSKFAQAKSFTNSYRKKLSASS